ncbi:MAG: bacteriohopanetetrol glucosamine biosynthesis glycosyltransferase HpnI [Acidobacteriaceae bacterium]|nr:bacteriohopanetetrol glucosamine biosynthesis glycosyltransferase HpnI [Acidobacteriaceae bacterium]
MHLFWLLFAPAFAYQCLSLICLFKFRERGRDAPPASVNWPAVSVLKPVRGVDPNTYEAFVSQAEQEYPQFEILFGIREENDPVISAIRHLQQQFPAVPIRVIRCTTAAPNGKVGLLIDLSREARYPIWVVNDGDIKVTKNYLTAVVTPLADRSIGVVTCPYRAYSHSMATRWEALGIASDFIPSTIVAQSLGVRDFGLGSTLAFRAEDLLLAGGFEALADYLADDFQLARRIASLGKRAFLSSYVVETSLGEASWRGTWNHQLRWARTIKASKGAGYVGLPITHAGLWAAIALACGAWIPAVALIATRISTGLLSSVMLRSLSTAALCWLTPVWDLYAFAIWVAAWTGNTVRWRDQILRIDREGRIRDRLKP